MEMPVPETDAPRATVSATRTAYDAIRQMIISGELAPGEKLKVVQLSLRLCTGASPIREALTLLVSDQLVERIDQRGFRAAPISQQNFAEILKLRCALEEMALRESLAAADDAWEKTLRQALGEMLRCKGFDSEVYEQAHKAFHLGLLSCCGSPILLRYCAQLYDLNVRYRNLALITRNSVRRDVNGEHKAIAEAALTRDPDLAVQRLLSHYRQTGVDLDDEPEVLQR